MMLQHAYTSTGNKIGLLWDSASDTIFCTNDLAKRLTFKGEPFTLVINGIAGIKMQVETTRFVCSLKSRLGVVKIIMYGIDKIACVENSVEVEKLVELFPDFSAKQLDRPVKCDILLSQVNANLMLSK